MTRTLFLLILAAPLLAQPMPTAAVNTYNEAQDQFTAGDISGALTRLKQAMAQAPDGCPPCHKLLFSIHFRQREWALHHL